MPEVLIHLSLHLFYLLMVTCKKRKPLSKGQEGEGGSQARGPILVLPAVPFVHLGQLSRDFKGEAEM